MNASTSAKMTLPMVKIEKRKVEEKFLIRDGNASSHYRFKEQRSNLRLRIQRSQKDTSRKESSIELAETSTAPTNRTKAKYVPLEDSLDVEGAQGHEESHLYKGESNNSLTRGGNFQITEGSTYQKREKILKNTLFKSLPEGGEDIVMEEEAVQFLDRLGMIKYVQSFTDLGFDCLDVLLEAPDELLKQIGVPIGFRIKFNKAKTEFKTKPHTNNLIARTSGWGPQANMTSSRILSSHNDEKEEKTYIKEENPDKEDVKSKTKEASEHQGEALSERSFQCGPINISKYCYKCFKQIMELHTSEYAPDKYFCSSICLKMMFLDQSTVCSNQSCNSIVMKSHGAFIAGRWHCSQACSPKEAGFEEPLEEDPEGDFEESLGGGDVIEDRGRLEPDIDLTFDI